MKALVTEKKSRPLQGKIILSVLFLASLLFFSHAYAGFESPVNIDSINGGDDINSANGELAPFISLDGLSLYYSKDTSGFYDLYVAKRPNRYSPFGNESSLSAINHGTYYDFHPSVTEDGLTMVYHRGDGDQTVDDHLKIVNRASTSVPFQNESTIREISPDTRDYIHEFEAHISPDGLTLYFARQVNSTMEVDIYRARRSSRSAAFAPMSSVSGINSEYHEFSPFVMADGLTIFFSSHRSGLENKFYMSTRADTSSTFGTPVLIDELSVIADSNYLRNISLTKEGTEVFLDYLNHTDGDGGWDIFHSNVILHDCFSQ